MTLLIPSEPSAGLQQIDLFNKGKMVQRADFSPSAGASWAVVGCVLADVVVPANEATLVAALEAKAEIVEVMSPRFWMPQPASVLVNPELPATPTHESLVEVWSHTKYLKGWDEDKTDKSEDDYEVVRPPLGKNCVILPLLVPASLSTAQLVVDLEAAVTSVAGFNVAEHLLDGVIHASATEITLTLTVATRIKPIEA